jgi:hypothetical protein
MAHYPPVEHFIASQEPQQQEMLYFLHAFMTQFPGVTAKLRYKIPFYYRHSWLCYLNPKKGGAVELAFIRGNLLSNAQGLLQAHDRKMVRGITFSSLSDIPEGVLNEIFQEALLLDEELAADRRK